MALGGGCKGLTPCVDELHRPLEFQGSKAQDSPYGDIQFSAKGAPCWSLNDPNLFQIEAQSLCDGLAVSVNVLACGHDHELSIFVDKSNAGIIL